MKHFDRIDQETLSVGSGRFFVGPNGAMYDLSDVNLLYSSVDTVRQLYSLTLDTDLIERWSQALEDSPTRDAFVEFAGHNWLLRRGGKAGYAYLLQNIEYGLVLLAKSNYRKVDQLGSHFKIELSPKVISEHCPQSLQVMMDDLARQISSDGEASPAGVAVHMALDVQGWEAPQDLAEQLICRSRKVTDRNGFTNLSIDSGEVATVYGKGQSFCFGSASSLQFAVYNKTREALAHDKWDYFTNKWKERAPVDDDFRTTYSDDLDVWRLEARFAHAVVDQFAETNGVKLKSYESVVEHLGGLWRYALTNFRLNHSRDYVHPAWTLFMEDARFNPPSNDFNYRRTYKTPGIGNEKNVVIALGNMLSIFARNKVSTKKAWDFLKKSGIWGDLMGYCKARKISRAELYESIEEGLTKRRLSSKVAS